MKKILLILSLFVSLTPSFAEKVSIDLENSQLTWTGKKVAGEHSGTIKFKSGYIEVENEELTGGEFVLDMNSINNSDLESPEYKLKLENHLKSNDFFNVSEFPEGKFVIKGAKAGTIPAEDALIIGDLTIKGHTHLVQLPAKLSKVNDSYQGEGKTTIDRTKWDIRYNSDKFFDPAALGDKLIYNEIQIGLNVVAK